MLRGLALFLPVMTTLISNKTTTLVANILCILCPAEYKVLYTHYFI